MRRSRDDEEAISYGADSRPAITDGGWKVKFEYVERAKSGLNLEGRYPKAERNKENEPARLLMDALNHAGAKVEANFGTVEVEPYLTVLSVGPRRMDDNELLGKKLELARLESLKRELKGTR